MSEQCCVAFSDSHDAIEIQQNCIQKCYVINKLGAKEKGIKLSYTFQA